MTRAFKLSAILLPVFWLTACIEIDGGGPWDRYQEDFHFSYPLSSGGRLNVENLNGAIEITSWEKDSIEISGAKHANSREALRDTKIDIAQTPASVSIRTVPPSGWTGGVGANYVIRVPGHVDLDRIVSSNGSIRINGVEGAVHLRTSNGSVRTSRTKGDLDAQTSNGTVEIDHAGNTRLRSSNGNIRADVAGGMFEAVTSNSPITAHLKGTDANQQVRLESSNGHIDVTMDTARDVRAHTSNSSISLHLPGAANARLRAHTSNSSVTTDFDILVHGGEQSKHTLEGNIGSGGPLLDLTTSNGDIRVLKF